MTAMSEQLKEELQTSEATETMADYEDHFDDANPWNRVKEYLEKKDRSSCKRRGSCQRWCYRHGRRIKRICSCFQTFPFLY